MTEEKNKIGFALKKITTEQFAIIESSYKEGDLVDLKAGLRFGMNFEKVPLLHNQWGFYMSMAAMLIIPILMVRAFRKRGWF